jgi:hypothetical protein
MSVEELLFFVEAEVEYSDPQGRSGLGAIVNCYTYVVDRASAQAKVTAALQEDGHKIIGLLDCYRVDEDSFKEEVDEEFGEPTRADLELIRHTADVYYAYFLTYPMEGGGDASPA